MKKTLLLLFVFMITVVAVQAQAPRFGVRLGANYSGISGDNVDDLDRIYGFHAGVTSRFIVSEDSFLTVHPEILYSQRGAEYDATGFEVRLDYVDVPVLARINAGPLYFEAGPQLSLRVYRNINSDRDDPIHFYNPDELVRRVSFSYAAGVGLAATSLGLDIGVRYNGDVSNLNTNDDIPNIRNNWFMLTVSYLFPPIRRRQPAPTTVPETEFETDTN